MVHGTSRAAFVVADKVNKRRILDDMLLFPFDEDALNYMVDIDNAPFCDSGSRASIRRVVCIRHEEATKSLVHKGATWAAARKHEANLRNALKQQRFSTLRSIPIRIVTGFKINENDATT